MCLVLLRKFDNYSNNIFGQLGKEISSGWIVGNKVKSIIIHNI